MVRIERRGADHSLHGEQVGDQVQPAVLVQGIPDQNILRVQVRVLGHIGVQVQQQPLADEGKRRQQVDCTSSPELQIREVYQVRPVAGQNLRGQQRRRPVLLLRAELRAIVRQLDHDGVLGLVEGLDHGVDGLAGDVDARQFQRDGLRGHVRRRFRRVLGRFLYRGTGCASGQKQKHEKPCDNTLHVLLPKLIHWARCIPQRAAYPISSVSYPCAAFFSVFYEKTISFCI